MQVGAQRFECEVDAAHSNGAGLRVAECCGLRRADWLWLKRSL